MKRESKHIHIGTTLAVLGILALVAGPATAQVPVDDDGNPIPAIDSSSDFEAIDGGAQALLSAAELETLVGPVALYPDDLLAIVLPASTYPLEIIQAARFLEELKSDASLKPDENWDESVIALLNYPEVVQLMSDDIDWTWQLGEAVIAQQNDLVAAVEDFRDRAYAAGNLKTDEYQTVTVDEGIIEIVPVDEEVIYVPYYEPEQVVYYSPGPVYHYYPHAYPVYYYPYPAGHYFGSNFFWGVTTAFTIGWASDFLHVYHHSYYGHPYYGYTYYGSHYRHASIHTYNSYYVNNHWHRSQNHHYDGDYWRPRHRGGARPVQQTARNTYYSGGQRTTTQSRNYRDGRTDGLVYNNDRTRSGATFSSSSRSTSSRRSRGRTSDSVVAQDSTRTRQGSQRATGSTNRSPVQFRPRGRNTYTGSVARRLEAGQDNSARPISTRSRNATGSAEAIRFRNRDTAANKRVTRDNTRRTSFASNTATGRTTTARSTTPSRQSTPKAQPRRTASRNSQPRQAARTTQPRQAARTAQPRQAARSAQPRQAVRTAQPRQATQKSQPRRATQASKPAQAKRSSESRPSSSRRPSRSATASRSNKGSRASSSPSRMRN